MEANGTDRTLGNIIKCELKNLLLSECRLYRDTQEVQRVISASNGVAAFTYQLEELASLVDHTLEQLCIEGSKVSSLSDCMRYANPDTDCYYQATAIGHYRNLICRHESLKCQLNIFFHLVVNNQLAVGNFILEAIETHQKLLGLLKISIKNAAYANAGAENSELIETQLLFI